VTRKISARTLAGLLGAYLARFPDEVAGQAARREPEEAAELLALLAPRESLTLLRLVDPRLGREWLQCCGGNTLRRLIRTAAPQRPEPEPDAGERALQALAIELLEPQESAD
jgi:hypothetical protein